MLSTKCEVCTVWNVWRGNGIAGVKWDGNREDISPWKSARADCFSQESLYREKKINLKFSKISGKQRAKIERGCM